MYLVIDFLVNSNYPSVVSGTQLKSISQASATLSSHVGSRVPLAYTLHASFPAHRLVTVLVALSEQVFWLGSHELSAVAIISAEIMFMR